MTARPKTPQTVEASQETASQTQLRTLTQKAADPLMVVSGFFPFTLFPDRVEVYVDKVMVIYNNFFFSREIFPVIYRDLLSASISTNVLFGTLKFELTMTPADPDPVSFLPRDGAIAAHQLITGLLVAQKSGIDLTALSKEEILRKVEQIGSKAAHSAE